MWEPKGCPTPITLHDAGHDFKVVRPWATQESGATTGMAFRRRCREISKT